MFCPNCGASINNGASFCPKCGHKIKGEKNTVSPFTVFEDETDILMLHHNNDDCLVYPLIPESKCSAFRANFNIDRSEQLLLLRDTSFWSSCDQGLALTDKGIHVIPDNENHDSDFCLEWGNLSKAEYQELCIYFYDNEGNNAPIHMSYFIKSGDENEMREVGLQLANIFTHMAQTVEQEQSAFEINSNNFFALMNDGRFDDAISFGHECIKCDPDYSPSYKEQIGLAERKLGNYERAINYLEDALSEVTPDAQLFIARCNYIIESIYAVDLNNPIKARPYALIAAQLGDDVNAYWGPNKNKTMKQDAIDDFCVYDDYYVKEYLSLPYSQRKTLMVVDRYADLSQSRMQVLTANKACQIIEFPVGHPISNQLYVGHPLIPNRYIPFENYQLELVEDKVREFCMLAQALGAKEISIECLTNNSSDSNINGTQKISGGVDYKAVNTTANGNREYSHHLIDELSHSINLHQCFAPQKAPYVPNDLVWYNNEPSWQRLVDQRLNGSLLSHEERIETKKSQMVEGHELKEIKGEISILFASMNMEYGSTEESKYQMQENAVLAIKIKFAPFEKLTIGESTLSLNSSTIATYSEAEQEYIDELKECLANGSISDSERRLLNKIRSKLGISEARAAELEQNLCVPQLTEDEQEYLDAFKDAMEDGTISDAERRLLDKIKKYNNISDERAAEIEKMV